jgi:sulfatase maturation enzyme AslB (radical SAM superfamily)
VTGGEPLLEFDLLREAVVFFKKNCTDKKTEIDTIPTNGTILRKDVLDFIKDEKLKIAFSFDGDRMTNAARSYKNGDPVFDAVWRNMEKFHVFMGHPPSIAMTVLPINVRNLYANIDFLMENGFYDIKPGIARVPVAWKQEELDILLSEFKKILALNLRRKLAGKPTRIYPLMFLWGNTEATLNPEPFHCGFGDKLILYPDRNIYNCELPFSGNIRWKDYFRVGSIRGEEVVVDPKKIQKICQFDIFKKFKLKVKNPRLAPLFKKYACLACDINGHFLNKSYIQKRVDVQIKMIEMGLKFSLHAAQRSRHA